MTTSEERCRVLSNALRLYQTLLHYLVKPKHWFREVLFRRENNGGRYFYYFLRQTYVQPYQWRAHFETFRTLWLNIGPSLKILKIRTTTALFTHKTGNKFLKQVCCFYVHYVKKIPILHCPSLIFGMEMKQVHINLLILSTYQINSHIKRKDSPFCLI